MRPPLSESITFYGPPLVQIWNHSVRITFYCSLQDYSIEDVSFTLRWGCYDELSENWVDFPVLPQEVVRNPDGGFSVHKTIRVERKGYYGATLFCQAEGEDEVVWQGKNADDDAKFRIDSDCPSLLERVRTSRLAYRRDAEKLLFEQIGNFEDFQEAVTGLASNGCKREISRIIYERSKDDADLRDLLSDYYFRERGIQRAKDVSGVAEAVGRREDVVSPLAAVLSNIGIGEVVLVSPEGPSATSGGLAQVMNGLLRSMSRHGIPISLICPLYEYDQGSKHPAAEEVLRNGVWVNDDLLEVKWVGEVEIPFGPTYRSNGGGQVQEAHHVNAAVYLAESDNRRVFFLRHMRYADRLYPPLMPDEMLRRAIFLSRGALELMKNPLFDIRPQLILSNDWVTALLPVFRKLDLRYALDETIGNARTIHLVHNGGKDYHGVIPARHDNQELFPMLELAPEHYGGLTDPHNWHNFNLTAAAIHHLDGALLVVSKPYAQQLLTWDGGEGLHGLVNQKRDVVFGISNAVDQASVRNVIMRIGKEALKEFETPEPVQGKQNDANSYLTNLLAYKWAIKRRLQQRMGLTEDEHAPLISFVGRLAEQKGIQLLASPASGEGISVLESLLIKYPNLQVVIAGPAVNGDKVAAHFRSLVQHLSWRYAGRIVGLYDFVHHHFALEIFAASNFSLMPSRYEPAGLTQLESLACGTLVIARNVGGISATLERFDDVTGKGNGFLFDDYTTDALKNTVSWAIDRTRDKGFRDQLALDAARAEHDWDHRMPQYLSVFQHLSGVLEKEKAYPHLAERSSIVDHVRA